MLRNGSVRHEPSRSEKLKRKETSRYRVHHQVIVRCAQLSTCSAVQHVRGARGPFVRAPASGRVPVPGSDSRPCMFYKHIARGPVLASRLQLGLEAIGGGRGDLHRFSSEASSRISNRHSDSSHGVFGSSCRHEFSRLQAQETREIPIISESALYLFVGT